MDAQNYFTEIEQEEIIKKFLDDINITETENIIKKEIAKHNYNPIELFHLNLPSESLKLINDYRIKCDCRKCVCLNHILFVHKDERWGHYVKPNYFFGELYRFPKKDELEQHFKLSKPKYRLFSGLFQDNMDLGKDMVIRAINANYHPKNVDKVLNEFNEIIKFIYENNFTKFENLRLNHYPEF